jgi:hypothetical protein
MTVLPGQLPAFAGWQLVDYRSDGLTTAAASGGAATGALDQVPTDQLWIVDHAVAFCTSAAPTTLRLYSDSAQPQYLLDGTDDGNFDVADWPNGLQLVPGRSLLAVWSGATDGAVGTITVQMRILQRITGT